MNIVIRIFAIITISWFITGCSKKEDSAESKQAAQLAKAKQVPEEQKQQLQTATNEVAGQLNKETPSEPAAQPAKRLNYGAKTTVPADLIGRWVKKPNTTTGLTASDIPISPKAKCSVSGNGCARMVITQRSVMVIGCNRISSACRTRLPITKVERDAPLFTIHHAESVDGKVEAGSFTISHEPLAMKLELSNQKDWAGLWHRPNSRVYSAFTYLTEEQAAADNPPTEKRNPLFYRTALGDGEVAEIPKLFHGKWILDENYPNSAVMTITKNKVMVTNCPVVKCNVTAKTDEIFMDNPMLGVALSSVDDAEQQTVMALDYVSITNTLIYLDISDHPDWSGRWFPASSPLNWKKL